MKTIQKIVLIIAYVSIFIWPLSSSIFSDQIRLQTNVLGHLIGIQNLGISYVNKNNIEIEYYAWEADRFVEGVNYSSFGVMIKSLSDLDDRVSALYGGGISKIQSMNKTTKEIAEGLVINAQIGVNIRLTDTIYTAVTYTMGYNNVSDVSGMNMGGNMIIAYGLKVGYKIPLGFLSSKYESKNQGN